MKTESVIIPVIKKRINEAWDEFFRVQLTPHDNYEGYTEKKDILRGIEQKICSLNFDLDILKSAREL